MKQIYEVKCKMFLTNQAIVTITFVVSVSRSVAPPDYQLPNLILMGIYVFLTLVVAVGAIWSVFITRTSLKASAKQSQDALAASEKQLKPLSMLSISKLRPANSSQMRLLLLCMTKSKQARDRRKKQFIINTSRYLSVHIILWPRTH